MMMYDANDNNNDYSDVDFITSYIHLHIQYIRIIHTFFYIYNNNILIVVEYRINLIELA